VQREEKAAENLTRRVSLLIEALNSTAIDVNKILSNEVADTAWTAYLKNGLSEPRLRRHSSLKAHPSAMTNSTSVRTVWPITCVLLESGRKYASVSCLNVRPK